MFCVCNSSGERDSTQGVVDTMIKSQQPSRDTLPTVNRVVVSTTENDNMNFEEDSNYGIGDDDAFTAEDFKVYRIKNDSTSPALRGMNDYSLTTAVTGSFSGRDTIILVIWFPGLVNSERKDPLISVSGLSIFNGNRHSYQLWKESGGIRKMSLAINQQVLDTGIILQNTYKHQYLDFSYKTLYNFSGHRDTIKIIVEDIYPEKDNEYSISEIKLDAIRYY